MDKKLKEIIVMYCSNCGAETNDRDGFCSDCGTTMDGGDTNVAKVGNYPLICLSSKWFYPLFELSLWLWLIGGTIGGGVIGGVIGEGGGFVLGIIIGFIVAFFTMVNYAGLISVFLTQAQNVQRLVTLAEKGKKKD